MATGAMENFWSVTVQAWQELQALLYSGDPPVYEQLVFVTAAFIVIKVTHRVFARVGAAREYRIDPFAILYFMVVLGIVSGAFASVIDYFNSPAVRGATWIS